MVRQGRVGWGFQGLRVCWPGSSSSRLNLGSSWLHLKQDPQSKLMERPRLNLFNEAHNLTRTELEGCCDDAGRELGRGGGKRGDVFPFDTES